MRDKERCRRTGKRRYRDRAEATAAVRKFARVSQRDKVPVRVYECDFCGGVHLTSQATWALPDATAPPVLPRG